MTEQNQGRRPKVLVAILHTGQVRWELSAWTNHLIANERRGLLMVQYFGGDSQAHPVSSNRNRILRDAPRDMDAVLMLDEDTIPHPHTIEVGYMCCPEEVGGMGLDVVIAPTPIWRGDDERGPVMTNVVPLGASEGSHDDITIPVGQQVVQEIKEGGTGVIAIARHVIDALQAPFSFQYDEEGVTQVGEDHQFCRNVREAGFAVHAALGYPQGHAKTVDLKTTHELYRPGPPRQLALLVTGTGRCGTGFASQWLTSAGVRCGHESFFMYRGYEAAMQRMAMFHQFAADASWMAAPYLDEEHLKGVPVVHQIRHPKKVIASWIRKHPHSTPRYWKFFLSHCPEVEQIEQVIDQFAARYVLWNELIESKLDGRDFYRWRVEDGEDGLLAWLADRKIVDTTYLDRRMLYPNKSYNSKSGEPREIALEQVSEPWRTRLAEIADRYGYTW